MPPLEGIGDYETLKSRTFQISFSDFSSGIIKRFPNPFVRSIESNWKSVPAVKVPLPIGFRDR